MVPGCIPRTEEKHGEGKRIRLELYAFEPFPFFTVLVPDEAEVAHLTAAVAVLAVWFCGKADKKSTQLLK